LLGYIKYLKDRHGEKIRLQAVQSLLPVRASTQPTAADRNTQDNIRKERVAKKKREVEQAARQLIIVDDDESNSSGNRRSLRLKYNASRSEQLCFGYIKHLKDRHGKNIRLQAVQSLLPVRASAQPDRNG